MRTSTFLLYILDATVDHALYIVCLHCNEWESGAAFNDAVQRRADQLDLSCGFPTCPIWEAMAQHEIEGQDAHAWAVYPGEASGSRHLTFRKSEVG